MTNKRKQSGTSLTRKLLELMKTIIKAIMLLALVIGVLYDPTQGSLRDAIIKAFCGLSIILLLWSNTVKAINIAHSQIKK